MNNERRKVLEPIFTSLDPERNGLLGFPPAGDDGNGDGSDKDLAQIILYGTTREVDEMIITFAIQLGRKLQRAGL